MSGPCPRPECGGEVHTDGWGTPVRCPAGQAEPSISDQLAAQLPPFSGDRPPCIKCGQVGADTTHRMQGEARPGTREAELRNFLGIRSNAPERLERRCLRCDYVWDEALVQKEQP